MKYRLTRDWPGSTVFILGGGPSLKGFDAEVIRGKGKVIAINDAGLYIAPWADVLYFSDMRWYEWNRDKMHLFQGKEFISRNKAYMKPKHVKVAKWSFEYGIHPHSARLGGWCSGGTAIDLAFKRGAKLIILLGYDMNDEGEKNWHDNHQAEPLPGRKAEKFIPTIKKGAPVLAKHGVRVFNATPGSALTCFPIVTLEEALKCLE